MMLMSRCIQIGALATVVTALCLVTVVPAVAAKKTTVRFTETETSAPIATDANFPAVGSHQLGAAVITTNAFGRGDKAQISRLTVTAGTAANLTYVATGTDFFAAGTQRWKVTGRAVLHSNGNITSTGRGTYVGGTGAYQGARGSFTFRSTQPTLTAPTVLKSAGTIVY
jgi:hypothetical protein